MDDDDRRRRAHTAVDRALERLFAQDMTGFAALWAPDGTMDFPFAPAGAPAHLEGPDEVAAYLANYTDVVTPERLVDEVRHDTLDPDTLVVEFAVGGTVVATREPYRVRYVAVVSVGENGVRAYRDYWNPLAMAEINGSSGEGARSTAW
jgi:uncharacterized protein